MVRWWLARVVCVMVVLVGARVASADAEGDAIAAALDKARPVVPMTEARREALRALDAWIARPSSERLEPVIAYYQAAVDRALDTLEKERVKSGLRIFQLYSSSVIVQTPETVFAFDLDQGIHTRAMARASDAASEGEKKVMTAGAAKSERSAGSRPSFYLTEAQVARVAALVDYSFHTHEHDDHIDLELTQALLAKGKTVVVTESNKENWKSFPWAAKLTVLDQTVKEPIQVGPLKVDVLRDFQWNNYMHTSGMPCNAYVVTTPGGLAVMTKGDINCGLQLLGWLSLLKNRGQRIDVVTGSVIFWRGVHVPAEWDALFKPLWLPGHCWEFGHRRKDQRKGNCLSFELSWCWARDVAGPERTQVLSWGEWIDVPAR